MSEILANITVNNKKYILWQVKYEPKHKYYHYGTGPIVTIEAHIDNLENQDNKGKTFRMSFVVEHIVRIRRMNTDPGILTNYILPNSKRNIFEYEEYQPFLRLKEDLSDDEYKNIIELVYKNQGVISLGSLYSKLSKEYELEIERQRNNNQNNKQNNNQNNNQSNKESDKKSNNDILEAFKLVGYVIGGTIGGIVGIILISKIVKKIFEYSDVKEDKKLAQKRLREAQQKRREAQQKRNGISDNTPDLPVAPQGIAARVK